MLSEALNVIFVDFNNVFGRQCINLKEQKPTVLAKRKAYFGLICPIDAFIRVRF